MRVVIVGVGDVGRELADNLAGRGKNELVLVDCDASRCEQLAGEIDALVLHGDGTNPDILKKARLAEAEALVASTGSDAMNTVIAMLGRHFGVDTIVVKLAGSGLRAACQEIGVKRIVTPTISAAAAIMDVLYGVEQPDVSLLERSGMQLVELVAGQARGKTLAELELPDGGLIIAVERGEHLLLARDQLTLEEGDTLLALTENEDALIALKHVLGAD